jgi:hypothetical protein
MNTAKNKAARKEPQEHRQGRERTDPSAVVGRTTTKYCTPKLHRQFHPSPESSPLEGRGQGEG